jgi:hypothetical protein
MKTKESRISPTPWPSTPNINIMPVFRVLEENEDVKPLTVVGIAVMYRPFKREYINKNTKL